MKRPSLTAIVAAAWRDVSYVRLWLPLYGLSLLLAVVQTWPLFDNRALHNPYLGELASGGSEAWLMAALSNPQGASITAFLYLAAMIAVTALFAGAYNFVSGGVLSVWAGAPSLARGGARYFLSFVVLGLLLILLGTLGLAGSGMLLAAGFGGAGIAAFVWMQSVNVIGEYARALAIDRRRRNPFAISAQSIGFVARRFVPVALLAVLGVMAQAALLAALAFINPAVTALSPWLALVVQQIIVFGLLWIKMLRLALAAQMVRAHAAP